MTEPRHGSMGHLPPVTPRDQRFYARAHHADTVLVLGILSLCPLCLPLGIVAWIMGRNDLKLMAAGQMDPSGESTTNVGRLLGMVSVLVWVTVALATLLFVLFAMLVFGWGMRILSGY